MEREWGSHIFLLRVDPVNFSWSGNVYTSESLIARVSNLCITVIYELKMMTMQQMTHSDGCEKLD